MEILREPVEHPSAWTGAAMRRTEDWKLEWPRGAVDELASGRVGPAAAEFLDATLREVTHGRGFVLLRGLPVDALDREALRDLYWELGRHWGTAITQNAKGDRVAEITDHGLDARQVGVKPSMTNAEQRPHSDPCDVVSLLCVQPAKEGGLSRIASSIAIYNRLVEEDPAALDCLYRGFHHDLRGDETPEAPFGCTPVPIPVYRWYRGVMSCVFNASSARQAAQRMGRSLPERELALLDRMVELAHSDELRLDMSFRPGDIQLLNNHTVIHWRTGFTDWPEPGRKRRLYRLWINRPGERPVDPDFHRGYITGSNAGLPILQ
jgi:alpha-ketoglutarate-dependent taurine dioxygenase